MQVKIWHSSKISLGKDVKTIEIDADNIKDAEAIALKLHPEYDRAKARLPLPGMNK